MLATLFLSGAALFGACLVRRVLGRLLDGAETLMWGAAAGWSLATVFVYLLARWQGHLTHALMAWATAAVLAAAAPLLLPALRRFNRQFVRRARLSGLWRPHYAGLAFVLLLFAPLYWLLFSTHTFARGGGGVYSGGSAFYDLSFHAALATSFAYGENFPAVYTPLPPEALHYPFMPDFLTAALMSAGLTMRAAMLLTAVPLALIITGLFYSFALRLARSQRAAALATILFLLNGGLGFLDLLRDWRASGRGFLDFWDTLAVNYANSWERGIHWTNLVTDTLLPQRASLFGLPLGLMIFTLFAVVWRRGYEVSTEGRHGLEVEGGRRNHEEEAQRRRGEEGRHVQEKGAEESRGGEGRGGGESVKDDERSNDDERNKDDAWGEGGERSARGERGSTALLLAAGVLAGFLPLFHTHTYIAVGLVSLFLFALRPRREWLAFWTPAVLLAAPQLLALAPHAAGGGVPRLQPGWMGQGEPHLALYLLRNFGLPLVLAVPAWFAAPREWRTFYLAFVLLLAFALVVVVSPNLFDNGKFTYYWHAVNSALVAAWLVKLAGARRRRPLAASFAALLALACVASGLAAAHSEARARARLFTDEELEAAAFAREHTPPRALFLTAPAVTQPVLCLAGRAVVRGPTSWLWSHGYEFRAREADVRRIYAGGAEALGLLGYYGVDYVYLGDAERRELKADASFFEGSFPAVYRGASVTIFDTRAARAVEDEGARPRLLEAPAPREFASRVGRDPFQLLVEFPRAGFFVHRLFKASYGRLPRKGEFMPALSAVGRGLYVGAPGWERRLEANRLALLDEWTAGEEFREAYGGRTNAEFVAALSKNAGVELGDGERDALVRRLDSGEESRRAALLRVVEDEGFYAREYDTAYVLVHFFGYLGRDPDAPPDRDLSGLDFWRGILDRSGDYRSLSRAFLESDEYKNRPPAP
jgi:hypothetical protein